MGLFVLPLGDTPKKNVEEAIANLRLFLENPCERNRYLLTGARMCLEEAEKKIKQKEK